MERTTVAWINNLEQTGRHVGRVSVAVDQIGLEVAQKAAGFRQAGQDAGRIPAHVEADQIERRGPLFGLAAAEHEQRNRMAARRHALCQRQRLPFRSADAQRGEHIRDPHSTHTLQKIKWNDDNARGQALAASRFGSRRCPCTIMFT